MGSNRQNWGPVLVCVSAAMLMVSLTCVLFYLWFVWLPGALQSIQNMDHAMNELTDTASQAVSVTPVTIKEELAPRIDRVIEIADKRSKEVVDRANERIDDAVQKANARISDVIKVSSEQLSSANASLKEIAGVRKDLKPAFQNVNLITARVREVADDNLECKGNGKCWPSSVTAILGGTKVALGNTAELMRYTRAAAPGFIKDFSGVTSNVNGITTDLHKLTGKWTAPTPWYTKVANLGVTAGVVAAKNGAF